MAVHPFCVTVYVNVTVPTPLGVKSFPEILGEPVHVPPVGENPVKVYGFGVLQTLASAPAFTVGTGLTVTVTVAVPVHPRESVTVTVYVEVLVGFARTVAPEVVFNPNAGDQA